MTAGILGPPLAASLQRAIRTTLNDGFQIATELSAWRVEQGTLALDPFVVSTIAMRQQGTAEPAVWGTFILAFDRKAIVKVLTHCGIDARDQAVIDDAVGEIANMIYGALKTSINAMGYRFVMELPATAAAAAKQSARFAGSDKLVMPFLADGHECRIVIAQAA